MLPLSITSICVTLEHISHLTNGLHQPRIYKETQEPPTILQLNKYETDPYFLQIFQSNTSVCLIISVFCKSCEPICEPEITPVLYHLENLQKSKQKQFHVQFTNLTKYGNEHRHALEILKKIWICLAYI